MPSPRRSSGPGRHRGCGEIGTLRGLPLASLDLQPQERRDRHRRQRQRQLCCSAGLSGGDGPRRPHLGRIHAVQLGPLRTATRLLNRTRAAPRGLSCWRALRRSIVVRERSRTPLGTAVPLLTARQASGCLRNDDDMAPTNHVFIKGNAPHTVECFRGFEV